MDEGWGRVSAAVGNRTSISLFNAVRYSWAEDLLKVTELNAQYGHLLKQKGKWI
jgi:hypothetical protein